MDIRAWATDAVADMTEEEVNRVLSEGADWYTEGLTTVGRPYFSPDDLQTVVEEIERLCRERVALEGVDEGEGGEQGPEQAP